MKKKFGQTKKVERMWRKKWTASGKVNEEKDDSNKETLQKKLAAKEKVCRKMLTAKEKVGEKLAAKEKVCRKVDSKRKDVQKKLAAKGKGLQKKLAAK